MNRVSKAVSFRSNTVKALNDPSLRAAMRHATSTFGKKRADGIGNNPFEEWREIASEIRMNVLKNLEQYVDMFAQNATKAGSVVHRAKDSHTA